MLTTITVTVRYGYSTYTATAQGKRASCTGSPDAAARALARKLLPGQHFQVRKTVSRTKGGGHFEFEVSPEAQP